MKSNLWINQSWKAGKKRAKLKHYSQLPFYLLLLNYHQVKILDIGEQMEQEAFIVRHLFVSSNIEWTQNKTEVSVIAGVEKESWQIAGSEDWKSWQR